MRDTNEERESGQANVVNSDPFLRTPQHYENDEETMRIPEAHIVTQDEVKEVAHGISAIFDENSELELNNDRLRTRIAHLKSEVQQVRCDNHTLVKQVEKMQYIDEQKDFEIEKLQHEVQQLKSELDALKAHHDDGFHLNSSGQRQNRRAHSGKIIKNIKIIQKNIFNIQFV